VHDWVARRRYHHQYLPDRVQHEPGAFTDEEAARLRALGHTLDEIRRYGNMQALVWNRAAGRVEAASDPRGEGEAIVFRPAFKRGAETSR
jgi:gamma-glutamyltranspeptidase/glutathione hydrolase